MATRPRLTACALGARPKVRRRRLEGCRRRHTTSEDRTLQHHVAHIHAAPREKATIAMEAPLWPPRQSVRMSAPTISPRSSVRAHRVRRHPTRCLTTLDLPTPRSLPLFWPQTLNWRLWWARRQTLAAAVCLYFDALPTSAALHAIRDALETTELPSAVRETVSLVSRCVEVFSVPTRTCATE